MWNTLRDGTLEADGGSIAVPARSLDSLMEEHGWPPLAGIKLDVEGAESAVLRGAGRTLAANPGAFLTIEVSGGGEERVAASLETLRWLDERGYRFRRLTTRGAGPPLPLTRLAALLRGPSWRESLFNLVVDHI